MLSSHSKTFRMMRPRTWRTTLTLLLAGINEKTAQNLPERFLQKIKRATELQASTEANMLRLAHQLRIVDVDRLDPAAAIATLLRPGSIVVEYESVLRARAKRVSLRYTGHRFCYCFRSPPPLISLRVVSALSAASQQHPATCSPSARWRRCYAASYRPSTYYG